MQASPGDDVLSNVHMEADGVRKASVPDDEEDARTAGPASEAPNETVDKFVDVTRRISEGTGFTGEDRDLAIELATELAKVERRPPRFVIALTKLIAAFAAADQSTYVDLLDDMFSTVTLKEPNLNAIVLTHLGQSILAVHEPTTLERFHRHCAAARNLGNFAGSLSPSAVFYFKHNEQGALRATLREVAELPPEHRVAIREYMERMSEPTEWMRVVTPQGERVAANYKEFLAEYRDRLA